MLRRLEMTKERNHPIWMNGDMLDPRSPEIGYATFSEALAALRALFPTNPIFTARALSTPSALCSG
jgi:hypothetical protein